MPVIRSVLARALLATALVLPELVLPSVGNASDAATAATSAAAPAPAPAPAPIPHRIVAFTCGAVDIITALGFLDHIIAVEEDCPAPGTENMVRIRNEDHPGQVEIVQIESIIALNPDLVIAKSDLKDAFGDRGLNILWSPPVVSMATLPGFVDAIATVLGVPDQGRALIADMDARAKTLHARTDPLPKTRVYYEVNGAGRTQGTATIVDAMIMLAGGTSLAGDDPRPNISLSPEAVVAGDPEVIILGPFAESIEAVCERPGWDQIAAVKNHRVFKIPAEKRYTVLGTPRCVQGCEEMFLPWIHPELGAKAP